MKYVRSQTVIFRNVSKDTQKVAFISLNVIDANLMTYAPIHTPFILARTVM